MELDPENPSLGYAAGDLWDATAQRLVQKDLNEVQAQIDLQNALVLDAQVLLAKSEEIGVKRAELLSALDTPPAAAFASLEAAKKELELGIKNLSAKQEEVAELLRQVNCLRHPNPTYRLILTQYWRIGFGVWANRRILLYSLPVFCQ